MKLIICLDDRCGMLFLGRRQSQDALLRAGMLALVGDKHLWMNSYSAGQFSETGDTICVHERFWEQAGAEDYCFAENVEVSPFLDRVEQLIVYRWNRHYPSDVKFPLEDVTGTMTLISRREFPGSSHDLITEEVYNR